MPSDPVAFTLPVRWPLVPVDVAAFYLNRLPEEVTLYCDSVWAWDIAARGAQRRQLRIWRVSLISLKNPRTRIFIPDQLEHVINDFLPRRPLTGRELQQFFFCGRNLIRNLETAGLLDVAREARDPGGPFATAHYTRESIHRFLMSRALGQPSPPCHPYAQN